MFSSREHVIWGVCYHGDTHWKVNHNCPQVNLKLPGWPQYSSYLFLYSPGLWCQHHLQEITGILQPTLQPTSPHVTANTIYRGGLITGTLNTLQWTGGDSKVRKKMSRDGWNTGKEVGGGICPMKKGAISPSVLSESDFSLLLATDTIRK